MARPREFDIDQALDAATETFWRQGYEGTSLVDLMDAMGLKKGSVYKAFGSKHELFIQVLKRYLDNLFEGTRNAVAGASTPAESIRRFVEYVRTTGYDEDMHKGCLAVNSVVELAPHDAEVLGILKSHIAKVTGALTQIIQAGQADGSFRHDVPAQELAVFLTVVAAGFVSTSRASLGELERPGLADVVLSALQG